MNLRAFLFEVPLLKALLVIVVFILPLRSVLRFFLKPDLKLNFYQSTIECIALLSLYAIATAHSRISPGNEIDHYLKNTGVSLIKTFYCCTIIILIDYMSMRLELRNRIKQSLFLTEKVNPVDQKLLFFTDYRLNTLAVVVVCILSAIWEEAVFRGLFTEIGANKGWNILATLLLSSLLFSLNHFSGGYKQIVFSFFFGTLFFTLYQISGSLISVIACHIIGNLFVIFYVIPRLNRINEHPQYF